MTIKKQKRLDLVRLTIFTFTLLSASCSINIGGSYYTNLQGNESMEYNQDGDHRSQQQSLKNTFNESN